jgi:hypothetical protein
MIEDIIGLLIGLPTITGLAWIAVELLGRSSIRRSGITLSAAPVFAGSTASLPETEGGGGDETIRNGAFGD